MKKTILFAVIALVTFVSFAQTGTCTLAYLGPQNSDQLVTTLNTSTDPAITTLSTEQKNSIVTYAYFASGSGGYFKGFSGHDANIAGLYSSNKMAGVLTAILKTKVSITSGPITRGYNVSLVHNGSNMLVAVASFCSNCYAGSTEDGCCGVGGDGCCDYLVGAGQADCSK